MRILKEVITWLGVLVVAGIIFGIMFWKYDDGMNLDYIQGKASHYSGKSSVTSEQAVYLYSKYLITDEVGRPKILENGLVEVNYNFYSYENLDYLLDLPYNFWDAPLFGFFGGMASEIIGVFPKWVPYSLLALVIIMILLWWIGSIKSSNTKVKNNKFSVGLWYVCHPKLLLKSNADTNPKYPAKMLDNIEINPNQAGIFAMRVWQYIPGNGYLHSIANNYTWTEKVAFANKVPKEGNENGLYGFRLGLVELRQIDLFGSKIVGIVSMGGEYVEHADGVIRSERCEILCLIVNSNFGERAKQLSMTFGVPVVLSDRPMCTYKQWVLGKNGIACLIHNAEILKEEPLPWEPEKELSGKGKSHMKSQLRYQS